MQNLVLVMVAPMLLTLGAPVRLTADLLSEPVRRPGSRVLHGRAARLLTFSLIVTVALVEPLLVLYMMPLHALTLRSAVASGVFLYLLREDERRAAVVDAEFDASEQQAKAGAEQAVDGADEGGARARLWWEDDPQIAQRFRRRR